MAVRGVLGGDSMYDWIFPVWREPQPETMDEIDRKAIAAAEARSSSAGQDELQAAIARKMER